MKTGECTEDGAFGSQAEEASADVPVGGARKRAFDVAVALLALLFFLPAIIVIVLAIKAFSPGPVLFGHSRLGFRGAPFKCLKFRTMVTNGDEVLKQHLLSDPQAAREWTATQKLRRDPRVTPIGRLLRKSSLDEIPQLINVLRGEMSIVGPRPIVTAELKHYGPNAGHYFSARPGLTGLWQVSGRSDTSYDARVRFDVDYVAAWSLKVDVRITAMTVPAVLLARGSV